jgi:hypothetical protein
MVLKYGFELGWSALKAMGNSIGENAPGLLKKGWIGLNGMGAPEKAVESLVKNNADDAAKEIAKLWDGDTVDLMRLGGKGMETAWWLPVLGRAGSAVDDFSHLKDINLSAGGNVETASENNFQLGLDLGSIGMFVAGLAVKNPAAKKALRAGGFGLGLTRDVHDAAMDSARGKSTFFDDWSWQGKYATIYTDQYGNRRTAFTPLLSYHYDKDRKTGYDYGFAKIYGRDDVMYKDPIGALGASLLSDNEYFSKNIQPGLQVKEPVNNIKPFLRLEQPVRSITAS